VNLRAALFRCLNELKKNGVVLGKETVLRKTMLDDCKGDKFFEVLAVFSTAVLKRTLSQSSKTRADTSIVRNLATASTLTPSEQASLLPLAIAHRSALQRSLGQKTVAKTRYNDLSAALDEKIEGISRRTEQYATSLLKSAKPKDQKADFTLVKRQAKENWRSDPRWLDVLIHGDGSQAEDVVLVRPFTETWQEMQSGRSLQEKGTESGLLQELENRVSLQQNRIRRWRAFHQRISEDNKRQAAQKQSRRDDSRNSTTDFTAHEHYRLGEKKNSSFTEAPSDDIIALGNPIYKDILQNMAKGLASASSPAPRRITSADEKVGTDTKSPKRQYHARNKGSGGPSSKRDTKAASRTTKSPYDSSEVPASNIASAKLQQPQSEELFNAPNTSVEPPVEIAASEVTKRRPSRDSPSPIPSETNPSPAFEHSGTELGAGASSSVADPHEVTLVDRIVSSVSEASPSPVKKPYLSLMERTRMSMAASFGNDMSPAAEADVDLPPIPSPEQSDTVFQDRRRTLLERTRQSMSNVAVMSERPKLKQRKSMTKKTRQSLYPVNQFETPRKDHESLREEEQTRSGKSTPKEVLFSDEAEYESVFKSRPKVAMSPVYSPAEEAAAETIDNSPFEAESSDLWVMSSPLVSRHVRRTKRGSVAD
jgi:hypothetical protein